MDSIYSAVLGIISWSALAMGALPLFVLACLVLEGSEVLDSIETWIWWCQYPTREHGTSFLWGDAKLPLVLQDRPLP